MTVYTVLFTPSAMLSLYMPQFVPDDEIEFSPVEKLAIVVGHSDAFRKTVGIGQMSSAGRNDIHPL